MSVEAELELEMGDAARRPLEAGRRAARNQVAFRNQCNQ
jgi:hypothetical protein